MVMSMNDRIVAEIKRLVDKIKDENDLTTEKVIRDNVFNILQNIPDCIVLYYPIEEEANEDGCDGCHVVRTIKGSKKQFVFINTSNTRERQAFSVAHELGHIWDVDGRLKKILPDESFDVEEVIDRFAAELLMPEDLFETLALAEITEFTRASDKEKAIKVFDFIKIIVYLMNYFFVPFKAVVLRLCEVGIITSEISERLLNYKDSEVVDGIIREEQYTRLGIRPEQISVANLAEKLDDIEYREVFSTNKIEAIRSKFGLKEKRGNNDIDSFIRI